MESRPIKLITKKSTGRKKLHTQNIWIIGVRVINMIKEELFESTVHQDRGKKGCNLNTENDCTHLLYTLFCKTTYNYKKFYSKSICDLVHIGYFLYSNIFRLQKCAFILLPSFAIKQYSVKCHSQNKLLITTTNIFV